MSTAEQLPVEAAEAGEAAATQGTRLTLIQGGASQGAGAASGGEAAAAAAAGDGAAATSPAWVPIVVEVLAWTAVVGAALLVLLWPSEIAPEPPVPQGPPQPLPPTPNPDPVQPCSPAAPCPPPAPDPAPSQATDPQASAASQPPLYWEPIPGESHPPKADVEKAMDTPLGSSDCDELNSAIEILARDLRFRRWDMQRNGGGDAGHRKRYQIERNKLRALIDSARKRGCAINPAAEDELNESIDAPTPHYNFPP